MQEQSETKSIAESIVPTFADGGKRADYLSYRITNFSFREACQLAHVSEKQVHRWRGSDPNFNHLDTDGLTELRKLMANQFLEMQFTRNMQLVLQKDFKVLYRDALGLQLLPSEVEYLSKIRQFYTPQALAMVRQLIGGGTIEEPFDFTRMVMSIQERKINVVLEQSEPKITDKRKLADILGEGFLNAKEEL